MFVKKLVEKASKKQPQNAGSGISGLKAEDVSPQLAFHYGIPAGSNSMAYDSLQHILAISTKDGRIKLLGHDNTQAILQSEAATPIKFLQFIENQGIILSVTLQNHIEVWDIGKKQLSYTHIFKEEISSFSAVPRTPYIYVGDCLGNITIFKLDLEVRHLDHMQYTIPFAESRGTTEIGDATAVIHTMPQPMAESKRILIIFKDGLLSFWNIQESKVVFISGGNLQHSTTHEQKIVVSACWACPFGSRVVVGYTNGEIILWALPVVGDQKTVPSTNKKDFPAASNAPLFKLNLGYKMDKVPIVSLRWVFGDGRANRLYVNGFSDLGPSHSLQVIILNESTESRTIKLVLPLTEACLGMELISCFGDRHKHKQNALVLLLKSGRLCLYDDSEVENYLLQSQTKSFPSMPNHLMVKLPYGNSNITAAQLYTGSSSSSSRADEDQIVLANKYSHLLSLDWKEKEGNHTNSMHFFGFTKTKNLYITGHHDGSINFWDASCPLLVPILSIEPQAISFDESNSSSGKPVTALHFDISSQILVSGDQSGLVRIITFRKEQSSSENIFSFLQVKQGGNYAIQSVKLKGAIISISINSDSRRLAIGTEKGFVFVINMETTNILYQKQFPSQLYTGIISLQFENCRKNGYEKNALLVGVEDSSVLVIDEDTGNVLSPNACQPKKPSRALLVQILGESPGGVHVSDCQDISNETPYTETLPKQSLVLLCSENAVRLYSLSHVIQGVKKSFGKKKLNGRCCYASVVYGPSSDVGLMLIFASGKIEIRSIPDLTLLKDASLGGFTNPTSGPKAGGVVCASSEGELVAVNGDMEIVFFSVLSWKCTYSHLEYISQVYKKTLVDLQEGCSSTIGVPKEKKKGIFSMVKDLKGNKSKHNQEADVEDSGISTTEELSAVFSTPNFTQVTENRSSSFKDEDNAELEIDDIDLEDTNEKRKGQSFAVLNKQKLSKKFQALKGKLKPKIDEKLNSGKEKHGDDKKHENDKSIGEIDQIKKKYGYSVGNESSTASSAKLAESKLNENVRKLQNIGLRTADMKDTAQSFSSMAKELLRTVQKQERNS